MVKSLKLPQEIIDNVITAVGYNPRVLKQCSLVSSSFLRPSRKQLFSRISIRSDETCDRIYQFLVQNPVIRSFVRSFTLNASILHRDWEWLNGKSTLAILRLTFCCLECFSIVFPGYHSNWKLDWNCFNSEMKDALSNIIQSSTLKTLSFVGLTNVPITFFLHIVHLTTLELDSFFPIEENSSSLTRAASKSVIDRCVWRFREQHVL